MLRIIRLAACFFFVLICSRCMASGTPVGWGDDQFGKILLPALPLGVTYTSISCGTEFTLGLRSDGQINFAGAGASALTIPALPVGGAYIAISAGDRHALAVRSDGQVIAWGMGSSGQTSVLPLPSGLTYVAVAAGFAHSLALRSDGMVIGFGRSVEGQLTAPALPTGVRYVAIAAGDHHSLALRSDGQVVAWGLNNVQQTVVPTLPAGVTYTAIAAATGHSIALRSDGTIQGWGRTTYNESNVPALPENVRYVAVSKADKCSIAIRSDGQIVYWGSNGNLSNFIPSLSPGTSFSAIFSGPMASHAFAMIVPGLPAGSAFSYQGLLKKDGSLISGSADIRVSLFRSSTGATQVGSDVTKSAIEVSQGGFSTELDFGPSAFDGTARWIEIAVRSPAGAGDFVTLSPRERISPSPMALAFAGFKSFIISHPDDADRYLVHAAIEGPEAAVYYRGTANLVRGRAVVTLPAYFDSLTRLDGRTIQLTNVGGFDRLAVQESAQGEFDRNSFTVCSDNPSSAQKFYWEVKAVRADGARLEVEPLKSTIEVRGDGPYTYSLPTPPTHSTSQSPK